MNMVRIRHIMEMRRASKAPPLLPPKLKKDNSEGVERRGGIKEILEINIGLRNFRTDLGNSPTMMFLFYESEGGQFGPWKMITSSDTFPKSDFIDLPEVFSIEFMFERPQFIRVQVCDWFEQDVIPLGVAQFAISELVNSRGIVREMIAEQSGINMCNLLIGSTLKPKAQPVMIQFSANSISKKVMPDGCSVYYIVFRIEDNYERTQLYRSESVKQSARMSWRHFSLQSTDINDSDERKLEVVCYYRDEKVRNGMAGSFITSYNQLKNSNAKNRQFYLANALYKSGRKTCGLFEVLKCNDMTVFSFLDYIQYGASLNLCFAVDFSEGDSPLDRDLQIKYAEDVEFAIRSMAECFEDYNRSKTYLAYGFGAQIPPQYRESHDFCLNLETDPSCSGVEGVVAAFRSTYQQIQPLASAHFAHVIYHVAKLAQYAVSRSSFAHPQYYVMTIISRGAIDDIKETVQAAIFASKAPISIIFLGVGGQNLSEIERLGVGGKRLAYQGRKCDRDHMQFVNLASAIDGETAVDEARYALSEAALYQVPRQLATYMMKNNILPIKKERCLSADSRPRTSNYLSEESVEPFGEDDFMADNEGSPERSSTEGRQRSRSSLFEEDPYSPSRSRPSKPSSLMMDMRAMTVQNDGGRY